MAHGRPQGYTRPALERARHSRTLMIRSLDYQTRKHVADIAARHEKIARLTAEIEELELQEADSK